MGRERRGNGGRIRRVGGPVERDGAVPEESVWKAVEEVERERGFGEAWVESGDVVENGEGARG